jgi:hypothetical protein
MITAAHVVENATTLQVNCNNYSSRAEVLYVNKIKDIALIKTYPKGKTDPIPVSFKARTETVYAMGFGWGNDGHFDIKVGKVFFKGITLRAWLYLIPGMSGGPVFDTYGNAVALNSATTIIRPYISLLPSLNADISPKGETAKFNKQYTSKQIYNKYKDSICIIYGASNE